MSFFDELATKYDLWYEKPFGRSAYELELSCIKSMMGSFHRALEIGVGTGRFASKLGVRFGVDPSFGMLRIAKRREILCVQAVGEYLPFRNGSFDLVLIVVSICFVDDPLKVLYESRRVLKEGGSLLLGLIPAQSRWADFYRRKGEEGHPIYKRAKFYPLEDIESMLRRSGFTLKDIKSTILEEPQDENPVTSREVIEGFSELAGFTCIRAT
jgi:ubiquinone/menaquinone biosynthesis C-methylase UbiE